MCAHVYALLFADVVTFWMLLTLNCIYRCEELESELQTARLNAKDHIAAAAAQLQEACRRVHNDAQRKLAAQQETAAEAAASAAVTHQHLQMQLHQTEMALKAARSAAVASDERMASLSESEAAARAVAAEAQAAALAAEASAAEGGREVARLLWELEELQQAAQEAKAGESQARHDLDEAHQKLQEACANARVACEARATVEAQTAAARCCSLPTATIPIPECTQGRSSGCLRSSSLIFRVQLAFFNSQSSGEGLNSDCDRIVI
jgi:chromosome segregation ATPase